MGVIPSYLIEQIRNSNDIVEVIGSYFPLKKSGANYFALCPFHKEKTPSFCVNPQKQIFYCFGCHKGGNVITFIMEYENLNFVEAVKKLADRVNIPIEIEDKPEAGIKRLKEQLYEIHVLIAERWHNCLLNEAAGEPAREYLKKRNLSEEAIKIFKIGYAPDNWDDTLNWGISKGYSAELLEKAGLIIKKEGTDRYYDRFRGRLMFPIWDEQGRVVAFSGRVISGDEKTAKYVNSPETPIFIKSKVFYGLDKTKRAILEAGYAIVCEGQIDLISCYMGGIRNVVAPQGTAFTTEHAMILKRYTSEVVLCFDSDSAGQDAAVRAFPHLASEGLSVKVAFVPSPHDPDSYIKNYGAEEFKKLIQNALVFYDYYLERLCRDNDVSTDRGKIIVVHEFGAMLKRTASPILMEVYRNKLAGRLGLSPQAIADEIKKVKIQQNITATDSEPIPEKEKNQPVSKDDLWLLRLALLYDECAGVFQKYLNLEWISDLRVRYILSKRLFRESEWRGVAEFIEEVETPEFAAIVTEATIDTIQIPNPVKQSQDIVLKFRNKYLDKKISELKMKLFEAGSGDEEKNKILSEISSLQIQKRLPLQPIEEPTK